MPGKVDPSEVLHREHRLLADPSGRLRRRPVSIDHTASMAAADGSGVFVQEAHLCLELFRVGPAIVALQVRDVDAFCTLQQIVEVLRRPYVLFSQHRDDPLGTSVRICPDDLGRPIGGTVVPDQHLIGKLHLLRQYALQRPADGRCVVVGEYDHAHDDALRSIHHLSLPFVRAHTFFTAARLLVPGGRTAARSLRAVPARSGRKWTRGSSRQLAAPRALEWDT